ncbi:AraC family transcriptional regulator [Cellulomonas sp. S1-8]|uniref:AraC family transcriptional regulator n=1 Tax=Cellulomonas sp. S1-8 TaxID=2904790 RepID=UPI00224411EF|nr:AraC family transcriptional regulator [Cellulomonas sp. S1-8]UZN02009.1 AraC family transcriptional regulator [Cellulomonas sp. S1-8]
MSVVAPPRPAPDLVGEALHRLRVAGVFYCRTDAAGDWAVDMPAFGDCLTFHVVTQGECWVAVPGADPVHLHAGDLALVPHGRGHVLASDLDAPSLGRVDHLPQEYVTESYSILRHDGDGPRSGLVCGVLSVDGPAARPLLDLLPAVVHVPESSAPWVGRTLELMAAELTHVRPGGEAVLTRLADVLVIQAVRAWLDAQEPVTGWIGGLRDPYVGAALAAVHRDPAHPWTVAGLAREAAMSRSAFSARFTEVVGVPAMRYVAAWRMHVAADRLAQGDGVAQAATAAGYESAAAFSRAFTRETGRAPGSVRRRDGMV